MPTSRPVHVPIAAVLCCLCWVATSGCWSDEEPPLPDSAAPAVDAAATDGAPAKTDGPSPPPPDGFAAVDQPLPPLLVPCTPADTTFSADACGVASVTVDRSTDPATCALRDGERQSGEPVLTFERQDDDCAGHPVVEVVYFARANAAWTFVSASHGLKQGDDTIREIPANQLAEVVMRTSATPPTEIAVSFTLDDKLTVSKIEIRR